MKAFRLSDYRLTLGPSLASHFSDGAFMLIGKNHIKQHNYSVNELILLSRVRHDSVVCYVALHRRNLKQRQCQDE